MKKDHWKPIGIALLAWTFVLAGPTGQTKPTEAAEKANPCNPCAAKANPCNPCAAKQSNPCAAQKAANPCNPCAAKNPCAANPGNPCAAGGGGAAKAQARMIIAQVIYAKADHMAVDWKGKQLNVSLSPKTQYRRGPAPTSLSTVKPGERVILSMLDRGGRLSANYVYLSKAGGGGNPCNPCAASNPCNPCAAKKGGNPCNPCAAK